MRNNNSNIQRDRGKVIFHTIRTALKKQRKQFAPSGKFLKRGVSDENYCLMQRSPFDLRIFFSVLATPLLFVMAPGAHTVGMAQLFLRQIHNSSGI